MNSPIRIFVGSSSEAKQKAEAIRNLLYDAGEKQVRVRAWWDTDVFVSGEAFIESLVKVMGETDVAIFVATPDDKTAKRGRDTFEARDNVVFECGLAMGKHTRERTAIVVFGDADLPSDLRGVSNLELAGDTIDEDFSQRNIATMRWYLARWNASKAGTGPKAPAILPKVHEAMERVAAINQANPRAPRLDKVAASSLESLAEEFHDNKTKHGITENVYRTSAEDLRDATATWAIDVLGPEAWLTPTAFRYLAVQMREYFRANCTGGSLPLKVSPAVARAIRRAYQNVLTLTGKQGATKFDDQLCPARDQMSDNDILHWVEHKPELEFVRILLWTKEEFGLLPESTGGFLLAWIEVEATKVE